MTAARSCMTRPIRGCDQGAVGVNEIKTGVFPFGANLDLVQRFPDELHGKTEFRQLRDRPLKGEQIFRERHLKHVVHE